MFPRLLTCLIVLTSPIVLLAQQCDDDSSFIDLMDSLGDLFGDDDSTDTVDYRNDSVRTEKTEWNHGISFASALWSARMFPIGYELGVKKQFSSIKKLYVGGAFAFHEIGNEEYDTLLGSYDHISTFSNLYSFDVMASYNFVKLDDLTAFFGMRMGTMFSMTVSKAIDEDCTCEQQSSRKLAEFFSNSAFSFGPFVGIQVPVGSLYDRFSFRLGYEMSGPIDFVKEGNVTFRAGRVHYHQSTARLHMLSLQIGFSHFF